MRDHKRQELRVGHLPDIHFERGHPADVTGLFHRSLIVPARDSHYFPRSRDEAGATEREDDRDRFYFAARTFATFAGVTSVLLLSQTL